MSKANGLNLDVSSCTGLPLSTGLSGNIPISCFDSGTNASSSTFLSFRTNGNVMRWDAFPEVVTGPQNSFAYYSAAERVLRPYIPPANSVFYYYGVNFGTSVIGSLSLSDGQFTFCTNSTNPATIIAGNFTGSAVRVINGPNSIELGVSFNPVIASSSMTMVANTAYIVDSPSLVTLTLPASSSAGQCVHIVGVGAGGWKIAQLAGQQIIICGTTAGNSQTTVGVTGSISSANSTDAIVLMTNNVGAWGVVGSPQSTGVVIV